MPSDNNINISYLPIQTTSIWILFRQTVLKYDLFYLRVVQPSSFIIWPVTNTNFYSAQFTKYLMSLRRRSLLSFRAESYLWWRHQMETFSALLTLCAGYSPATSEFPSQRPVKQKFDVFFDMRLNKRLSKQSRRDLSRHCAHYDVTVMLNSSSYLKRVGVYDSCRSNYHTHRHMFVWDCCSIGHPSKTHHQLKSRENSFAHTLFLSCSIALNFFAKCKTLILPCSMPMSSYMCT